jgi:hypothetical protein
MEEKDRRDRKDFNDFDDFDDFMNGILQTPASELELFAGSEDETSTGGFMFLSEDETTGWDV